MGVERLTWDAVPESVRRITAWVVAISCHLGLLMLLLRPGFYRLDGTPGMESTATNLQLRFVSPQRTPAAHTVASTPAAIRKLPDLRRDIRGMEQASPSRMVHQPAVRSDQAPGGAVNANASSASGPPRPLAAPARNDAGVGDGGFHERLLDAESSSHVRGVPGSDRRRVPGIQLTDPLNQGVGGLMRSTQRLFGVTNRHCIDVEVWRSLSPEERIARHISSGDIARIDEEYKCDKPLGLTF